MSTRQEGYSLLEDNGPRGVVTKVPRAVRRAGGDSQLGLVAVSRSNVRPHRWPMQDDRAVRDPAASLRILPVYLSGDQLHPNDADYQATADVVDLRLLASRSGLCT
jgi:hypothetical protein